MTDRSPFDQRHHVSRSRLEVPRRQRRVFESVVVLVVVAAVIAMAVWFVFVSTGGIGPGTV
jgi:hypothetical protein